MDKRKKQIILILSVVLVVLITLSLFFFNKHQEKRARELKENYPGWLNKSIRPEENQDKIILFGENNQNFVVQSNTEFKHLNYKREWLGKDVEQFDYSIPAYTSNYRVNSYGKVRVKGGSDRALETESFKLQVDKFVSEEGFVYEKTIDIKKLVSKAMSDYYAVTIGFQPNLRVVNGRTYAIVYYRTKEEVEESGFFSLGKQLAIDIETEEVFLANELDSKVEEDYTYLADFFFRRCD